MSPEEQLLNYGFCHVSIAPLRRESNHRSEQVSQLLFGDLFRITNYVDEWAYISTLQDNYQGWIEIKQFIDLDSNEIYSIEKGVGCLVSQHVAEIVCRSNGEEKRMSIVLGSRLPAASFFLGDTRFTISEDAVQTTPEASPEHILKMAEYYLGTPYLWGGKSPFGIDCSGFVQMVYQFGGILLPRDAYQQVNCGRAVGSVEESKSGDLAFFSNPEGRVTHVGICLGNQHIVHASGMVRVDPLDNLGIFHVEKGIYSHYLCSIRRIFTSDLP